MNQVLFYSINPEHLVNILNGHKTIEVRKSDLPQWAKDKLARGEIVEGYGYCTKGKPYLHRINDWRDDESLYQEYNLSLMQQPTHRKEESTILNGLVVVKFEVSGVTKLDVSYSMWTNAPMENEKIILKSCLTAQQIEKYSWDGGTYKDLYAHHITNIQPIEPMELGEFYSRVITGQNRDGVWWHIGEDDKRLTKAPQSFQSAWVKGE